MAEIDGNLALKADDNAAQIAYTIELVTPEQAAIYLKHRAKNRGISSNKVESYVADIRAGRFQLSHQAIAFDEHGVLFDGQHRLAAIVRAGRSIVLTVARYHVPPAMAVIDSGISRSFKNVLQLNGFPYATEHAAAVTYLCYYDDHMLGFYQRKTYSPQARLAVQDRFPNVVESVKFCSHPRVRMIPASALAFVHCLGARKYQYRDFAGDPATANEFVRQVQDGNNLDRDVATFVLRETLMRTPRRAKSIMNSRVRLGLVIKAYNFFALDRPVKLLKLTSEFPTFGELD